MVLRNLTVSILYYLEFITIPLVTSPLPVLIMQCYNIMTVMSESNRPQMTQRFLEVLESMYFSQKSYKIIQIFLGFVYFL